MSVASSHGRQGRAAALPYLPLHHRRSRKPTFLESKADVTVELVKVGRTDFRFVLLNRGLALATDVNFSIAEDSADNPLVKNECERKLPYPKLEPGQSFTLIAALHMGSAMKYATHL